MYFVIVQDPRGALYLNCITMCMKTAIKRANGAEGYFRSYVRWVDTGQIAKKPILADSALAEDVLREIKNTCEVIHNRPTQDTFI